MRKKLRTWTHRYSIWTILCGLDIVLLVACATPDTTGTSGTQSTPSSVKVISSPHPTVAPSPTPVKPSTSCSGYKVDDVCIIDPMHILTRQPSSDAVPPITQDLALAIGAGTVTISQKYGILYLTLLDEGGSGNDKRFCRELIFSAFFVTEHDYLFPGTNITCHAYKTILMATLSKKTAKKINWDTSLTADEEATIAWKQYDTRYETA